MEASETHVLMLLAMLAEQSGETVSETRIDFVGRRLLEVGSTTEVCKALQRLVDSARRFPTVAEVRAEMGQSDATPRDEAMMIADVVTQALSRFGWLQPSYVEGAKAREIAVGPTAWALINRQGGWNAALERFGENQAAFRAQLRDAAEVGLKTGTIERGQAPARVPSPFEALELAKAQRAIEGAKDEEQRLIGESSMTAQEVKDEIKAIKEKMAELVKKPGNEAEMVALLRQAHELSARLK